MSPPFSSMAVRHGPCLLNLRKRSEPSKPSALGNFSYLEHKTNDWGQSKINSFVGSQEPLLATVKETQTCMVQAVTHHISLFKTILQGTSEGLWHCGRQRKCWTDNIKSRHICPCQNSSQGPTAEKAGFLLNHPSCPLDDPISQGTELNWMFNLLKMWLHR